MRTQEMPLITTTVMMVTLVVVSLLAATTSAQCVAGGYDLTPIPTTQLSMQQQYNGQSATYFWVINFCMPVSNPPDGATTCTAKSDASVLPGYITEYSATKCQTSWGTQSSIIPGVNSVNLTYGEDAKSNNPFWTATVVLSCGATVAPQQVRDVIVTGNDLTRLHFEFALSSSAACQGNVPTPVPGTPVTPTPPATPVPNPNPNPVPAPPEESAACGGGCAFTIIVFVGGFVYVVVTVLWYYFRQGKRGLELLPHPEFWKEFGACVKDGVIFSVQKIRALACKSGPYADSGYQQV